LNALGADAPSGVEVIEDGQGFGGHVVVEAHDHEGKPCLRVYPRLSLLWPRIGCPATRWCPNSPQLCCPTWPGYRVTPMVSYRHCASTATLGSMSTLGAEPANIWPLLPDDDPDRPRPIAWSTYCDRVVSQWDALLATDPEEHEVQAFLELHPAMIPGGSGDVGPGGHHRSEMGAVFRRPKLDGAGRTFEPDFMWVTRSTSLITPILVEIEKPSKRWFRANGRPTAEFREAHDQLNDWRAWFTYDENKSLFRKQYLFEECYRDRVLEPQFVLIYGRQSEFALGGHRRHPDELRRKRDTQRAANEQFMTFDSLAPRYDHANSMTLTMTSDGPRLFAFSPMYATDAFTGPDAIRLGDPTEALDRSVMISKERRKYIAARWAYWLDVETRIRDSPPSSGLRTRRTGLE